MPMELSFRLILVIVVGLVIVLAILVMFWNAIAQFLGFSTSSGQLTINEGTKTLVRASCNIACMSNKDAIRAGATWQTTGNLNNDGYDEIIKCTDGSIVSWGNNNQPAKCSGVGCEKTCSCVENTWYQAPQTC